MKFQRSRLPFLFFFLLIIVDFVDSASAKVIKDRERNKGKDRNDEKKDGDDEEDDDEPDSLKCFNCTSIDHSCSEGECEGTMCFKALTNMKNGSIHYEKGCSAVEDKGYVCRPPSSCQVCKRSLCNDASIAKFSFGILIIFFVLSMRNQIS